MLSKKVFFSPTEQKRIFIHSAPWLLMCLLLARDIKGALGLAPLYLLSILPLQRGNQLTRKVSTCSKKRSQPAPGAGRDLLSNKLTNCLVSRLWWATPSLLYEQSYSEASWCHLSARDTNFFVVYSLGIPVSCLFSNLTVQNRIPIIFLVGGRKISQNM